LLQSIEEVKRGHPAGSHQGWRQSGNHHPTGCSCPGSAKHSPPWLTGAGKRCATRCLWQRRRPAPSAQRPAATATHSRDATLAP